MLCFPYIKQVKARRCKNGHTSETQEEIAVKYWNERRDPDNLTSRKIDDIIGKKKPFI